ncbi:alpha/beta hydrolase [Pseudomonas gozinkensis]|uniref:alpha/beta hydrolase n=1 Tax=Pseudomonas gozinkensis TaxID=2774461 RepID=UPI001787ADC0|nr:alpha/beta hydrolase [Pseudomonas gozinkensis]
MEVENPALKDCKTEAASHELTCKTDQSVKAYAIKVKKIVVFFIGGAGDKEQYYQDQPPHRNVVNAQRLMSSKLAGVPIEKFRTVYLSYKDVRGKKDINKYVLSYLGGDKSVYVSIVGHSLGGWNGAHLSAILKEEGYTVKSLVTLDPVGGGMGVWMISDIYFTTPKPSADYWINVLAKPDNPNDSDNVAELGERWLMKSGPDLDFSVNANHEAAGTLFGTKAQGGQSACELVAERMLKYLEP